jgi:hypothetical protein
MRQAGPAALPAARARRAARGTRTGTPAPASARAPGLLTRPSGGMRVNPNRPIAPRDFAVEPAVRCFAVMLTAGVSGCGAVHEQMPAEARYPVPPGSRASARGTKRFSLPEPSLGRRSTRMIWTSGSLIASAVSPFETLTRSCSRSTSP